MFRRRLLAIVGATVLAGCSGGDDTDPTPTPTVTPTPPPDPVFDGVGPGQLQFGAHYLPSDEAWGQEDDGEWVRCTNSEETVRVSGRTEVYDTVPNAIDAYDELVADLGKTDTLDAGSAAVVSPGTGIAIGILRVRNAVSEIRAIWIEDGAAGSLSGYAATAVRNQAEVWEQQAEE